MARTPPFRDLSSPGALVAAEARPHLLEPCILFPHQAAFNEVLAIQKNVTRLGVAGARSLDFLLQGPVKVMQHVEDGLSPDPIACLHILGQDGSEQIGPFQTQLGRLGSFQFTRFIDPCHVGGAVDGLDVHRPGITPTG